jgi:hypothetical protein
MDFVKYQGHVLYDALEKNGRTKTLRPQYIVLYKNSKATVHVFYTTRWRRTVVQTPMFYVCYFMLHKPSGSTI